MHKPSSSCHASKTWGLNEHPVFRGRDLHNTSYLNSLKRVFYTEPATGNLAFSQQNHLSVENIHLSKSVHLLFSPQDICLVQLRNIEPCVCACILVWLCFCSLSGLWAKKTATICLCWLALIFPLVMLTLQVHTQLHLRGVHHTESSLSIVFWLHPNVQTSLQARSREIQKK